MIRSRLSILILLLLTASQAMTQQSTSAIEIPVDDAEYGRILEYYNYDQGMPSDPVFFGEWPWLD